MDGHLLRPGNPQATPGTARPSRAACRRNAAAPDQKLPNSVPSTITATSASSEPTMATMTMSK